MLIPFRDSDDEAIVKVLQRTFYIVLLKSPVKMIACLLSPKTLIEKYKVGYLRCIGSVRLSFS